MLCRSKSPNKSINLLDLDRMDDGAWFTTFNDLENSLVKSLVLVALIQTKQIITLKESLQMKRFLIMA